ncbi:diguanylate cyclase [Mangrovibacter sp. MFB070]|uniref:GGDEF domain-containing protein n=1 Tax=Mangrovibacter sp. MFB070 TaxID=1224318 RepID=UPI0004D91FDE|nr:diguanylate cyclase [Mangrovibacter sp. MFB070]KEA53284.1 diguanylate cyclase [Mangrovibacter sp. MFB070]
MTTPSWQGLMKEKYQLSLRLFLLLNALSSLYCMLNPVANKVHIIVRTPVAMIFIGSTFLLISNLKNKKIRVHINIISLIFGIFWAWNAVLTQHVLQTTDLSWFMVTLLAVLFIGAIAFINNLISFLLHCLPTTLTILFLSRGEYWVPVLFAFALPTIGIAIHQVIKQRNDRFILSLLNTLEAEKETLIDLSMIDPLTGLYNRRGFENRTENALADSSSVHTLLLLDIDHFKAYNDHYGHMMGDQALTRVSAAIRDTVRSRDIVGRYGGEEFMVLLVNTTPQQASEMAERIRQRVYDLSIPHMFNESVATNVTISIGTAQVKNNDMGTALSQADQALYSAKNQGRNSILSFDTWSAA